MEFSGFFLIFDSNIFYQNKGIGSDMCLILSNLILVSTVCNAHQQMKLAGKELKAIGL